MANYNDEDKRLKQDTIEQEKKQNASTGMIVTAIVIAIGIVMGFYFYNRPVPPVVDNTVVPATAPIPVEAPVNTRTEPATQPVDTTTTTTTNDDAAATTAPSETIQ